MKQPQPGLILLACLVSLASLALFQSCTNEAPKADATAELTTALKAQADRWDKAIINKDRKAIEDNMADDFRQIDGQGNIETKSSFVEGLITPDLVIDPYGVEEFEVRIYGDVALLSGRTQMTGKFKDKPFASHYRYIDIYVRRDGKWKVASVQISKLPA